MWCGRKRKPAGEELYEGRRSDAGRTVEYGSQLQKLARWGFSTQTQRSSIHQDTGGGDVLLPGAWDLLTKNDISRSRDSREDLDSLGSSREAEEGGERVERSIGR